MSEAAPASHVAMLANFAGAYHISTAHPVYLPTSMYKILCCPAGYVLQAASAEPQLAASTCTTPSPAFNSQENCNGNRNVHAAHANGNHSNQIDLTLSNGHDAMHGVESNGHMQPMQPMLQWQQVRLTWVGSCCLEPLLPLDELLLFWDSVHPLYSPHLKSDIC